MALRITWNIAGFRDLRRSAAAEALVTGLAEATAAASGDGVEVQVRRGKSRVRAVAITATPAAMVRNARDNTLVNNLGAGVKS